MARHSTPRSRSAITWSRWGVTFDGIVGGIATGTVVDNKACNASGSGRAPVNSSCPCAQVRYLLTVFRLTCRSRAMRRSVSPNCSRRITSRISNTSALLPAKIPSLRPKEGAVLGAGENSKSDSGSRSGDNDWLPIG